MANPQLWLLPCPVAALGVTLDAPPIRSVATVFTSPSVHASIHLDFGSSSTTPTYPVAKTLTDPRIFSWYGYTSIHRSYWIGYTTVLHPYLKLQDTQPRLSHLSSYHVQERSVASFSWLLERSIQPPSLLPWRFGCCSCVARPAPVLKGCSSETSFFDGFNGSSFWCFVIFVLIANFRIVLSALVADSISCNIAHCVFCVVQGVISLSVKIALFYPFIRFFIVYRFAFGSGSLIALAPPFVTFPSLEDD
ncbi:unnamed protein product [Arabidopsis halleri]